MGVVKGSHEETSIRHGIRRVSVRGRERYRKLKGWDGLVGYGTAQVVLRWSFCDQVSALGERVRNKLGHSTSTESAG